MNESYEKTALCTHISAPHSSGFESSPVSSNDQGKASITGSSNTCVPAMSKSTSSSNEQSKISGRGSSITCVPAMSKSTSSSNEQSKLSRAGSSITCVPAMSKSTGSSHSENILPASEDNLRSSSKVQVPAVIGSSHQSITEQISSSHQSIPEQVYSSHQTIPEQVSSSHKSSSEQVSSHQSIPEQVSSTHKSIPELVSSSHMSIPEQVSSVHQSIAEQVSSSHQSIPEQVSFLHQSIPEQVSSSHESRSSSTREHSDSSRHPKEVPSMQVSKSPAQSTSASSGQNDISRTSSTSKHYKLSAISPASFSQAKLEQPSAVVTSSLSRQVALSFSCSSSAQTRETHSTPLQPTSTQVTVSSISSTPQAHVRRASSIPKQDEISPKDSSSGPSLKPSNSDKKELVSSSPSSCTQNEISPSSSSSVSSSVSKQMPVTPTKSFVSAVLAAWTGFMSQKKSPSKKAIVQDVPRSTTTIHDENSNTAMRHETQVIKSSDSMEVESLSEQADAEIVEEDHFQTPNSAVQSNEADLDTVGSIKSISVSGDLQEDEHIENPNGEIQSKVHVIDLDNLESVENLHDENFQNQHDGEIPNEEIRSKVHVAELDVSESVESQYQDLNLKTGDSYVENPNVETESQTLVMDFDDPESVESLPENPKEASSGDQSIIISNTAIQSDGSILDSPESTEVESPIEIAVDNGTDKGPDENAGITHKPEDVEYDPESREQEDPSGEAVINTYEETVEDTAVVVVETMSDDGDNFDLSGDDMAVEDLLPSKSDVIAARNREGADTVSLDSWLTADSFPDVSEVNELEMDSVVESLPNIDDRNDESHLNMASSSEHSQVPTDETSEQKMSTASGMYFC